MCLLTKEREPRIAKEDITVLKYVMCENGRILSPFQGTEIPVNEVMVAYPKKEIIRIKVDVLNNIIYSLSAGAIHAKLIDTSAPYSGHPSVKGRKAIIPAGTEYWVGVGCNEIAARSMIITDINWKEGDNVPEFFFEEILKDAPEVNGVRVGDYLLEDGSYAKPRKGLSGDDVVGIVAGFHEGKPLIAATEFFRDAHDWPPTTNSYMPRKLCGTREKAVKMFDGQHMTQVYEKTYGVRTGTDELNSFEICINYRKDKGEEWYFPAAGEIITMLDNSAYLNAANQITGLGYPLLLESTGMIISSIDGEYSDRCWFCSSSKYSGICCFLDYKSIDHTLIPFLGNRNNEPKCQDCGCEMELNTTVNS